MTDSSPEPAPGGRPIDLVHLARQSLGDKGLECELLGLFARQAHQILAQLDKDRGGTGSANNADLAHTLKGSALAIGATRVAEAAAAFEATASLSESRLSGAGMANLQMQALRAAVDEARAAVAQLLAA